MRIEGIPPAQVKKALRTAQIDTRLHSAPPQSAQTSLGTRNG